MFSLIRLTTRITSQPIAYLFANSASRVSVPTPAVTLNGGWATARIALVVVRWSSRAEQIGFPAWTGLSPIRL